MDRVYVCTAWGEPCILREVNDNTAVIYTCIRDSWVAQLIDCTSILKMRTVPPLKWRYLPLLLQTQEFQSS